MRKFVFFCVFLSLFCHYHINAQDITIAGSTDSALYFPVSPYHWISSQHSQSIYPASMLTELQGKYITALTWYMNTPSVNWLDTQIVRLGITNSANLSNGLINTSTLTEVWSGRLSIFAGNNMLRIPLDIPFLYYGLNLIVEIVKDPLDYGFSNFSFYGQNQSDIMSLNQVGTYYPPYEGYFLPKLTFTCQNELCSYPEYLQVSDITHNSATLSWTPGILGDANEYIVAYRSASDNEYTEVTTTDTFLTVTDLQSITTYYWKVKAQCIDTLFSGWSMENTFTTQRFLATIPYFCDFEDSVENANWNTPIAAYTLPDHDKWHIGTYVSHSGDHSMYVTHDDGVTNLTGTSIFDGFNTYDCVWAYREFYIDTLYPQYNISFKHRGYGSSTAFFGPPDNSPFNSIMSSSVTAPEGALFLTGNYVLPRDSVWMEHSCTISLDTPGVYRLYFSWHTSENNGKPGASIDDISITGVSCLPPNTLTSTNITDSSATLSWQHDCVNSPMAYVVGYKTTSDNDYTEFTVYDTNEVTLTGLTHYTTYYWRVKTLYNDSVTTDWSSVANFQTDLTWIHPLPYTCDFEDAAEILTWNVPVLSGNNKNRWYIGHNTYSSANTSLYVTTNANGSNNTYNCHENTQIWTYRDLYFDPQYSGYELSFDAKVKGCLDYAFAQVFIGMPVTPTDSSAFGNMVLIDSIIEPTQTLNNNYIWKHFDYTLDSTFAGHRRIFFAWQTHPLNYLYPPAIAIDDISITGTYCAHPLQRVSAAKDTTVLLSWQNITVGTPESYTVAYKATTDSVYTLLETPNTSLTINGLQPLTDYVWKVRSNCSNEEHSDWSIEESFKTFQMLTTIPYTCDFEDSLENTTWNSYYGLSIHRWCIGNAVQHNGQNSCYISKDNGATYQTNNSNFDKAYLYRDFIFDPTYDEYVLEFNFKTFDTTKQTDISVYAASPNLPDFIIPSIGSQVKTLRYTDTLWHPVSIAINRTHSGIQRLVFEWTKPAGIVAKGSCAIDDITLTAAICGRPYALEVSDITLQSALLSWVSGNRHTPTSYTVAYRAYSDTLFTTLTLTDTFCPLNQLSPSTPYIWKVRANSSAGDTSAWSEEKLFSTAAVTPYFTSFEDTVENHCWHDSSEGDNNWVTGGAVHCDSLHSLYVSNNNGLTNNASNGSTVVYKDIYFGPCAYGYHLSFDHYGKGISVYVGNVGSDISAASLVENVPNSAYWRHHHIVLDTTYIGLQRVFLVGSSTSVTNKAGAIDNFMAEAVSCPAPVGLTSAYTDATAFQLSWSPTNGTSPQAYQVAYKLQQDHDYTIVSTTDTFVTLSGLASKAYYYWKVRSLCSNSNYGEWSTDEEFLSRQALPYFCDFEDAEENANWYIVPNNYNYWVIGAVPADNGNTTLHLGSGYGDGAYNYYASACLWVYRDIYIGGGNSHYQLSFDFRGLGQANADFARVYLGPPATPSGLNVPSGAEQIGGNFCMVPTWTHYSFEIDSAHTGLQRLYFQWRCDDNSGLNPGATFDNITIQFSDCAIPVTPRLEAITATTATLSWSPGNPNALPMNYTVAYRPLNDNVYTELTSNDTLLQITGLQPDSYYYWKVRANCSSTDSSLWSESRVFATTQSSPATTPYLCGFEDTTENAAWSNRHVTGPSKWVVGSAVYLDGNSALYVSDNDGATCSYTSGQNSTDWFYRDIYFQPGNDEYEISFDFKGMGTNYHYARVYLGKPEVMFESFTPEGAELLSGSLYNVANWQHYSYSVDSTHAGLHRLYVLWQNNTYHNATQPPAAFDNITIQANYCREPINLTSVATSQSTTLSWTMRYGGTGEDYTVAYRTQNDTTYTFVNVSDNSLLLQNLISNEYYFWKVRHNCDTACSIWSDEKMFYTNDHLLLTCDFDAPGSTMGWRMQSNTPDIGWYVGRHNDYAPEGMLYVSADSGQTNSYNQTIAADLWAYTDVSIPQDSTWYLSFDFKGMGETNYDYMNVYMGTPTQPSGSATPQGAVVLAQKIGQKANWTHYTLSINPTYTGYQRIYFHWHNDNSSGTNPPAAIDNVIISKSPLQLAEFLQVTPYDTAANVIWSFGNSSQASSYTLSYGALYTDSLMTEINLSDTTCILGNLLPNTDYLCKVRANYADGHFSSWRITTFHTQILSAHVPYYCGFEDLTENGCWQFVTNGTVNQWVIDTAATNGGERSLYISNDGGATNAYTTNTPTNAWAYRDIYLDPAQSSYMLCFDFRGEGELYYNTLYDYAKVFIGPPIIPAVSSSTVPSELTQLDMTLYGQSEWTTRSVIIDNTHTGFQRLFLYWTNDYTAGHNPAAAFDNISIVPFECTSPTAIIIDSISYTEVSLHLTDSSSDHHDWDVAIIAENETLDETLALTLHDNMQHTFTALDSGTVYTLYARTHCSNTTFSEWITLTITTLADTTIVDTTHHEDTVSVARYQLEQAVFIYPNPSTQYVNVYCKNGINISQIEVYDTYGKLLLRSEAIENPKRLNISELAAGMYLMRIITDSGVVTKPFIRR